MSLFPAYNDGDASSSKNTSENIVSKTNLSDPPPRFLSGPPRKSSSSSSSESEKTPQIKKRKVSKKRRKHRRSFSSPEFRKSKSEYIAELSTNKNFLEETGLKPEEAFRIDTKAQYKFLTIKELPIKSFYHRNHRLDRTPKKVFFSSRFYDKKFIKKLHKNHGYFISPKYNSCIESSYIKFDSTKSSNLNEDPLGIYDEKTREYLGNSSSIPETPSENIDLGQIREKIRKYNQDLKSKPSDIDLWLEYVQFQDIASELESKTLLIEKKLSILKTAIDKNPRSIELAVARLELSKEILDAPTIDRQWKEIIFCFPDNLKLWKEYVAFKSTHFSFFSVSEVVAVFVSCFVKLRKLSDSPFRPSDLEETSLELFIHLAHFYKRSGYFEKALGLFQSQIEFNFKAPVFPGHYSLEDRMAIFEPFWESGAPRFGEIGSQGWNVVHRDKFVNSNSYKINEEGDDEIVNEAGNFVDKLELWLQVELSREGSQWLPIKVETDETEDVDRIVRYDIIYPFLFRFLSPISKFNLVISLFDFLLGGLSIKIPNFSLTTERWNTESFEFGLLNASPKIEKEYRFFVRRCFLETISLFENTPESKSILVKLWLRTEVVLGLDDKTERKEVKNLVKSLLSKDQKNSELFAIYGSFEYDLEGYKTGYKIFSKVLQANFNSKVFSEVIDMELSQEKFEENSRLLWLFVLSGLERKYHEPPTDKIKILDLAEETKSLLFGKIHEGIPKSASIWIWIVYLTENFQEFIRSKKFILTSHFSFDRENFYENILKIWNFEIKIKENKSILKFAKEDLKKGLEAYPDNFVLLSSLSSIESNPSIRSFLWKLMYDTESVNILLSGVQILFTKFKEAEDEPHISLTYIKKARSLISKKLKHYAHFKRNPLIWRIYMLLTYIQTESLAEIFGIFYQSMQDCPQNKSLYLDVFNYSLKIKSLIKNVEEEENVQEKLKSVLTLMEEKEIRIRCPLEELELLMEQEPDQFDLEEKEDDTL